MNSRRQAWLTAVALALAGLAAYAHSLSGPLVFDDLQNIRDNPSIRSLTPPWPALSPPEIAGVGGRPLFNLSFALNYAMGGLSVRGYHLGNLGLHLIAGLLLFGIVRRTAENRVAAPTLLAFSVALLWLLHPLQTEAVTYLTQRTEVMMGMFYLATLYAFIRSQGTTWLTLSVLFCFCGMASKEVMVTAPLMVLLYDRLFIAGSFRAALRRRRGYYAALAASWIFLGSLMIHVRERGVGLTTGVLPLTYALGECRGILKYLTLALLPHPLVFDYGSHPTVLALGTGCYVLGTGCCVLALGCLVAATGLALRHRPALGYAACWIFVILAPTSSFVPLAFQPVAEHRMYLPLAGVITLVVLGMYAALGRRAWAAVALLAVGLGCLTARRNQDYRSALALWSDTVEKCPGNGRAQNNLGLTLADEGRLREAIPHYEAAVRLDPENAEAHNNLGNALLQSGQKLAAVAQYREALRIRPDFGPARHNLGVALGSNR